MDRRTFLLATAASIELIGLPEPDRRRAGTRLILLGTAGGPRPRLTRASPSQVIIINGAAYVVDCGNGVARQLVAAGVPLRSLRHVLITHHHSDHDADYGNLLLIAWTGGLQSPVDTWGPPPLRRMTDLFFEMNATDIAARIADERRAPLQPLIRAHDVADGGVIFRDENVTITAAVVDHAPMKPALAYRFDAPDRSIVISGDTTRSENLVRLARGADVLVHEAIFPSAIKRLVANVPNAPGLEESILRHHTTAEEVGLVAREAGVKMLVLSHLIPVEDPEVTDEAWIAAVRKNFEGRIVLGRDLLEV